MKIVGKALDFFSELFEYAKSKRDKTTRFEENKAQYEGTSDRINGVPLAYRRNITYELIESQVSSTIPSAKVTAERWSEKNERNAIRAERFLNAQRNKLPCERMNDRDERSCYVFGTSVWLCEWDDSIITGAERGGIRLSQRSIEDFVPQPGLCEINEMDYCFVICSTTREDVMRRYGISPRAAENAEKESDRVQDDDTVDVIICWYRDDEGNVCQYAYSGDVELCHIEDYYSRKTVTCRKCHKREGVCACTTPDFIALNKEYEELTKDVQCSDGSVIPAMSIKMKDGKPVTRKQKKPSQSAREIGGMMLPGIEEVDVPILEKTRLPWYKPKSFPVILRRNVSREGSLYGQSDCETIRPQQEEVNKILSRLHEKVMSGTLTPYKPQDSQFIYDNSIGKKVLNLRPNESPSQFGVLDTTYQPQPDLLLVENCYETAKRILGITSSYQGRVDTSAKSGIAKQVQVQQAAGRLESKRMLKNAAWADIDRVMFELHLAFADEPRPIAYRDEYGRLHNETFNRYDYLELDEETGKYIYNDRFLFSAELTNPIENQREALWQINLQNLQAGVYGNPQDPATLLRYWQQQEKAHFPYAAQNAEYFAMLVGRQQMQSETVGDFSAAIPDHARMNGSTMANAPRKERKPTNTAEGVN